MDPLADADEAMREYGIRLTKWADMPRADAIVAAVAHSQVLGLSSDDFAQKLARGGVFIDVKAAFDARKLRDAGYRVWRL